MSLSEVKGVVFGVVAGRAGVVDADYVSGIGGDCGKMIRWL